MKKILTTLFSLAVIFATAYGQPGTISGTVTDVDSGAPLIGANVLVEGTSVGASTDLDGNYSLSIAAGTYTVLVTYVGYQSKEAEVSVSAGGQVTQNFALSIGGILGDEIVVSASKKREKLTESPATIETIFAKEIEEYAGFPAELISRQKGVDYFRAGVAVPAFNIRGFNSNFNSKNLQVTDGRLSTLVATGLPFGPLNTTVKEDIERMEVILGPNATLYGPNAHNGLLNVITKDPRTSPGTIVTMGAGNQGAFTTRLRHAQVLSDQWAFKVTGEYTKAEEFEYIDSVYIDRRDANGNLIGSPDYAGPDGRTEGYEEFELDRDINFLRTEAALYFSPSQNSDFIFNWGRSNSNYLSATNVGRNQIKDWKINYYQLRFSSPRFFAQAYYTTSKTDSTYSIDERTKQYYRGIDAGLSPEQARGNFSYASGALFQDDSRRWNAEIQYNNTFGGLELVAGAQYQLDKANSLGTYLLDENEDDFIDVYQYGAYMHLDYRFGGGWRAIASARADYHEIYEFNLVPKFGLLYSTDAGTFRATYGRGIAAPTILNMFGNLFSGLILGNAEGFTRADGSMVEKQTVEKLSTIEAGFKGQVIKNKLFLDINAYANISEDFLSPVTSIGVVTQRGNTPIEQVQAAFSAFNGLVFTYRNFGKFTTYGADLGFTYYFNPKWSIFGNYSYFGYEIDEDNLENDFTGDGRVNFLDLLVNAPRNKAGLGISHSGDKFFGSLFSRWVEEYNYFSSFQIASETIPGETYRGVPIVEDARSNDTYNYGPLGGFVTVDLNLGYRINDIFTLGVSTTNLFNVEQREFTATPPTGRLFLFELTARLPAIGAE